MYFDLCLWVLSKLCQLSWRPKFKKSPLQMCSKRKGCRVSKVNNEAHPDTWMPKVSVSNFSIFMFSTKFYLKLFSVCMNSRFYAVVVTCDSELYFWIAFSVSRVLRHKDPFLHPLFCEAGRKALTYILVSGYERITNASNVGTK